MDETRFAFGKNWSSYAKGVNEPEVESSGKGLSMLLPEGYDAEGKSFLDIGCGSGLHSVAAAKLGFSPIISVDYDEDSVSTTRELANKFAAPIDCFRDDILNSKLTGQFDVVYSWGVLHHTGDMKTAINTAKALVKPGGLFIIAIYVKTPFCGMWKRIKRTYSASSQPVQKAMVAGFFGALKVRGVGSHAVRGMDIKHDAIDWLGGYPYESATASEIERIVGNRFKLLASFNTIPGKGLFGTGCAEYTFQRQ